MGHPQTEEAFSDAVIYLDRALESEKGIRVKCKDPRHAFNLRMRCYAARKRAQQRSMRVYDELHHNYGRSPYDGLTFWRETDKGIRVPGNPGDLTRGNVLVIAKTSQLVVDVEEL